MRRLLLCLLIGASASLVHARSDDAPVADAAMRRDAAAVRALLKDGRDVNAAQGDGMTALHWAAMNGDRDLARMLLYAGANVRAAARINGYTPLFLASQYGHAALVAALLEAGADPKATSRTGSTPLMLAAAAGAVEAVTRLLDAGADVNAKESARGQTALMFAAAYNRVPVVTLLASRGADLGATSKLVDLFAESRSEEQRSAARGAQAAPVGRSGAPGQRGRGAASDAPRKPQVPGVDRGYNYLELIGYQGGATALLLAAREGHAETVSALLDAGADINQAGEGHQTTALLAAAINGRYDVARLLLDRGADPNMAAENGVTPLFAVLNCEWAPKSNYPQPRAYLNQRTTYLELMTALLDKGADPNARLKKKVWYSGYNSDLSGVDEIGATPFWRAAYASDVPAMKLLVSRGADPDIATMKPPARPRFGDAPTDEPLRETSTAPPVPIGGPSVTPLHAATGVGYALGFAANEHRIHPAGWMPAVRYLVEELRADVNARDADGNTALHHAAARGDNEMIEYLVAKGADLKAVNRRGQNVADMANGPVQRTQPYPETLKLLERLGVKHNNKCVSC
jgi:uncharacterized protein